MNRLEIGFSAVNITPCEGIGIAGYFIPRFVKGVLDDIYTQALAVRCGESTALLISVDNVGLKDTLIREIAEKIERETGVSRDAVLIGATHSHTAPLLYKTEAFEADVSKIDAYREELKEKITEAARLALSDLSPARMGFGRGHAPDRIAYIRRYRMKDGTTMTCPPIDDPNIEGPIGELDREVNIIRFKREGARDVVLLNFGLHADTVNGDLISADWPCWLRRTVDAALGADCMFFPGAEGDVGSTNVHPVPSDMNDTEISFDNEMKSPGMARFVGRALAGVVLQVYDKVEFSEVEDISTARRVILVPSNKPKPSDMPLAREYKRLHDEGRDDLIPYTAMELTTVVAEALRMCRLENAPDFFELELIGLRLGDIALVGLPGEPFTDIGVAIKKLGGYDMILPIAQMNGDEGYFPSRQAFDEGGYEARSSHYVAGIDSLIVDGAKSVLAELGNG